MPRKEDRGTSRRNFLKMTAVAAAAASSPVGARELIRPGGLGLTSTRGNTMAGRIVMFQDPTMNGHTSTIDYNRVEQVVLSGVKILTSQSTVDGAFQSLFPGVSEASTFAIKVNCIGPCDTRWETVRGVVAGLSQMFGGTYDVSQVVIFDRHNLHSHGYDEANFTFNGNYPTISHSTNAGTYPVYGSYRLSDWIVDSDYLINIPALKCHSDGNNQITVALKNHYGSCYPSSLCGNITGMLAINKDETHVKPKTGLLVTCGLRGTYSGGPGEPPQWWNTFPEGSPNTLFFTTDPVTNEYWARDMINAERTAHNWSEKPCPWIEQAADEGLGIADPQQMTVVVPSDVPHAPEAYIGNTILAPNSPNPFSEGTSFRFRLGEPGHASLMIIDAQGRFVRHIAEGHFPAGYSTLNWDGRDAHGQRVATGVYFARLEAAEGPRMRRILAAR